MSVRDWTWSVLCILVVSVITVSAPLPGFDGPTIGETNPIHDRPHAVNIGATTPHDPISISGNQDFISQGWPGNGTQVNPYRLENLSISGNETCISISDTDAFFTVTGCVLSAVDVPEGPPFALCVQFLNVTNGILMNSVVSSRSYAVLYNGSNSCSVVSCQIDARFWCVHFENSSACMLSWSAISSSDGSEVYLEDTSQVRVLSNVVVGGHSGGDGILVSGSSGFEVSNNEVGSVDWFDHDGISVYDSSSGAVTNNTVYQNRDGIALDDTTYCDVINNSVYDNVYGIDAWHSINCTFDSNSIHDNRIGLMLSGHNNMISRNSFQTHEDWHAYDSGSGNVWFHNWWDDYIGYGWYPVEGSAGSYDTNPEPRNIALIGATAGSILLIVLGGIMFVSVITRRVRRAAPIEQSLADWDTREHFSLPLVVTMLLSFSVHLYLPAFNPARWSVWTATPLGVLSWNAYPSWGHQAIEFVFPVTEDIQLLFFYILFGFLWFILNAVVVRRFWLFTGGDIDKRTMKKSIDVVLLVMLVMSLATLTIPLPVTPLAALLQVSRFNDTDSSSETVS